MVCGMAPTVTDLADPYRLMAGSPGQPSSPGDPDMTPKKRPPPWNRGLRGAAAGWTPERKRRAAERHLRWIASHPEWLQRRRGERPDLWKTGSDPAVHQHYYRFLRARAQARFWAQEWWLTWTEYYEATREVIGRMGRGLDQFNLVRINTRLGWSKSNVELQTRRQAMHRKHTTGERQAPGSRGRPQGLGRGRHWWRKQQEKQ